MSNKLTDSQIADGFENVGLFLLRGELEKYKKSQTKLNCVDVDGFIYFVNLNNVKTGQLSNKYHKSNPNTIFNIRNWIYINNLDFDICEQSYINNEGDLFWECKLHGRFRKSLSKMQRDKQCPICSSGTSVPERFCISILNQLGYNYKKEKVFNWSKGKRYDFYIECLNLIIECHGMHHVKDIKRKNSRSFEDEIKNDELKYDLAIKNGINYNNYISICCKNIEFEYLKSSFENSLLSVFNDAIIDWNKVKCDMFSSNGIKACKLWNEGISISDISEVLKITNPVIIRYLKEGTENKLCYYNGRKQQSISGGMKAIPIVKLDTDFNFIDEYKSATEASTINNIGRPNITNCCLGKRSLCGGFKWMYKSDYDKLIQSQQK